MRQGKCISFYDCGRTVFFFLYGKQLLSPCSYEPLRQSVTALSIPSHCYSFSSQPEQEAAHVKPSGAHLSDLESCEWFSVPMKEEEAEGAWHLARVQPVIYVQHSAIHISGAARETEQWEISISSSYAFPWQKKPHFSTWLWHLASASAPSKATRVWHSFFSAIWDGANPTST